MALKLETEDSVLIATIDRPVRKNAVDQETLDELASALPTSVIHYLVFQ